MGRWHARKSLFQSQKESATGLRACPTYHSSNYLLSSLNPVINCTNYSGISSFLSSPQWEQCSSTLALQTAVHIGFGGGFGVCAFVFSKPQLPRALAIWLCIRLEAFGFHKLWLTLWRKKRWRIFHVRHFNAKAVKPLECKGGKTACLAQWWAYVSKPLFSIWAWEHPKSSWTEIRNVVTPYSLWQQAIRVVISDITSFFSVEKWSESFG